MCQGGTDAAKASARTEVVSRERCEHGQGSKCCWELPRNLFYNRAGRSAEQVSRRSIAAMTGTIDQGPQRSGNFRLLGVATEQPSTDPEQQTATLSESFDDIAAPRERLEHGKPDVFKARQVGSFNAARDQLRSNLLQPRF
jgi:hypothetical protein